MNYYTIDTGKIKFKVGYDAGKFKKIEKLRGTLDNFQLKKLGQIIPPLEASVDAFAKAYPQLSYQTIKKVKSQYTMFLDAWMAFYERYTGIPARFNAAEGAALKKLIIHFEKIGNSPSEALELWHALLHNWKNLSDFHQKNTDLKYINSQINKILHELKSKHSGSAAGGEGRDFRFS